MQECSPVRSFYKKRLTCDCQYKGRYEQSVFTCKGFYFINWSELKRTILIGFLSGPNFPIRIDRLR